MGPRARTRWFESRHPLPQIRRRKFESSRKFGNYDPSVTAIAAGLGQSCALTRTGGVKCWGSNGHDELGDGTRRNRRRPVGAIGFRGGQGHSRDRLGGGDGDAGACRAVKLRWGLHARCRGTSGLTADVKLLVRVKRLLARVRISYTQPAGGTATATRTIRLTAPSVVKR